MRRATVLGGYCLGGIFVSVLIAMPHALAAAAQDTELKAGSHTGVRSAHGVAAVAATGIEAAGFAREMPPGAPMGAAYLTLRDLSGKARVLTRVELPSHPQGSVAMHTTLEVAGVNRMRALEKLTLPGNGTVEMRPGATHLMVQGVVLRAGDSLPVQLVFADGSSTQLVLPVRGLNDKGDGSQATEASESHHHHQG